jgi:dimethylargininase
MRLSASSVKGFQNLVQTILVSAHQVNGSAGRSKCLCDRPTDSLSTASHDRGLAIKSKINVHGRHGNATGTLARVKTALVRDISDAIESCELTHLDRVSIDLERARSQHAAYGRALSAAGCQLVELPADPECPDCVFIEDTLVVVPELAVLTRPGAISRRAELPVVEEAVRAFRPVVGIDAPGTLDGGDVLKIGRHFLVGQSSRSNSEGIGQLRAHLAPHGYTVEALQVAGCLHLKSACSLAAPDRVLVNPEWVDRETFDVDIIEVDPREPDAANVLLLDSLVLADPRFPHTIARLRAEGIEVREVPNDELAKAEAALTCCSVILD